MSTLLNLFQRNWFLALMLTLLMASFSYGEYLETNAVPVTAVPSHFMCEHDTIGNHYICYGESK